MSANLLALVHCVGRFFSGMTNVSRSTYIAVDLGASSGRVMRGTLTGVSVQLEEIHRFATPSIRLADGLHWDIGHLRDEILAGVAAAIERGPAQGIGFDSWGVDYALVSEDGALLGTPFHHRDARTSGLATGLDGEFLFAETGIQTQEINTLVQLLAEKPQGHLADARTLLLIPDLFGYLFTGRRVAERTITSTSQLLSWDGVPSDAVRGYTGLPDLLAPGTTAGSFLGTPLRDIRESTGFSGVVLSVAGHDTASAVVAIPAEPGTDIAFVSCGTWVSWASSSPLLSSAQRVSPQDSRTSTGWTARTAISATSRGCGSSASRCGPGASPPMLRSVPR